MQQKEPCSPTLFRSLNRALQGREPLVPVFPTFCSCITPPSNYSPATAEEVKRSQYLKKKGRAVDILTCNRLTFGQTEHSTVQSGLLPEDPRSPQQQWLNRVFKGREDGGRFAWLEAEHLIEPLYFSAYWVLIIAPPTSQVDEYMWKTRTPIWHLLVPIPVCSCPLPWYTCNVCVYIHV